MVSPASAITGVGAGGTRLPAAERSEGAQAQSDAQAEQSRLDESLHSFKYYPVISLGLAYTF